MICSVVRLYCLVIKMIFLLPLFWSKSIQRFSLSTQFKASHVQQKYMLVGFRGFVYKYWKLEIMKNHMTCVRIEIWYRYSSKIMFHLICFFFSFLLLSLFIQNINSYHQIQCLLADQKQRRRLSLPEYIYSGR